MFCIISYDTSNDRKRNKIAKTLIDFGTRVQYSVFEYVINDKLLIKRA
ncbi:CRISPR-associated endonuclease Cas2 [Candidatus Acidulodesulfobacterium sp. H_13]